jgi:hypothetical protein
MKEKNWIALSGYLALEEAMDLVAKTGQRMNSETVYWEGS